MIRNPAVLTGSSYASMFFLGVGTVIIGAAAGNIGLTPYQTGMLVTAQNIGFIFAVLVSGALADSTDKARLMAVGSFVLALSFMLYYRWSPYGVNLLIMLFVGVGIGTYEGVADAMLLGIHTRRQGMYISINHFFVTFGCLATTLYLIFLQMDWRRSMVQSAVVVVVLALVFLFSRAGTGAPGATASEAGALRARAASTPGLGERLRVLRTQSVVAVFLALAILGVGIELGVTSLLTTFLLDLRGYNQVTSKIGLVLFLGGVASGRVVLGLLSGRLRLTVLVTALFAAAAVTSVIVFFVPLSPILTGLMLVLYGMAVSSLLPLLITMTGKLFKDMSGTALGIVKLGIPIGGIVVPFVLSLISRWGSFLVSLAIFPLLAVAGCILLATKGRAIQARLTDEGAPPVSAARKGP